MWMYTFLKKAVDIAAPLKVSDISLVFSPVSDLAASLNRCHENQSHKKRNTHHLFSTSVMGTQIQKTHSDRHNFLHHT